MSVGGAIFKLTVLNERHKKYNVLKKPKSQKFIVTFYGLVSNCLLNVTIYI
jgi:hypothetical protein